MSDQVGSAPLGVPFRSQIAVSVSQNVRAFLGTMGFRYGLIRWQYSSVKQRTMD